MCNPRRVMIQVKRSINEAWRQTIEQAATATEGVTEIARIRAEIRLADEMGPMALEMLGRVLKGEFGGFEPWQQDDAGRYLRYMEGVTLIYDPQITQLILEAQFTETISAEARASIELSGITVGEVAVDAVGQYFEDGWGGRTRDVALADARRDADRRLTGVIETLHQQQHKDEIMKARSSAHTSAEADVERKMSQLRDEARSALRDRLEITLAQSQEQAYHIINQAVGEAYRQTLRRLVMDNGGRIIVDEQTGSVINMELELY